MYKSIAYARDDGDHDLIATLNNSGCHLSGEAFNELTAIVASYIAEQAGLPDIKVHDRQDAPDVFTIWE